VAKVENTRLYADAPFCKQFSFGGGDGLSRTLRSHPFRQLIPHDLPVVDLFSVRNKPAVPYGAEKLLLLVFFVNPDRNGVQDKDVMVFDTRHSRLASHSFISGALTTFASAGVSLNFSNLFTAASEQEPIDTTV
jgi:hypothetical protein